MFHSLSYCGRRQPMRLVVIGITALSLTAAAASAQTAAAPQNPSAKPEATKAATEAESKAADSRAVLLQMNNALEGLAARVSPAVVQILVTGYGPLKQEDRSQTAFIVRQHAVGSGVIVDSSGYIMTNAHVVEGAQRIRVALPLAVAIRADKSR